MEVLLLVLAYAKTVRCVAQEIYDTVEDYCKIFFRKD